jgi:hypothetical protein
MAFLIFLGVVAAAIVAPSLLLAFVVSGALAWRIEDPLSAASASGLAGVLCFWAGLIATFAFVINLNGTYFVGLLILLLAIANGLIAIPFFLAFAFLVWLAKSKDCCRDPLYL